MRFAVNAIESLPETPLTAAGYNVRFGSEGDSTDLLELTSIALDKSVSDAGFSIKGRATKRTLEIEPGVVNLEITSHQDGNVLVGLNFHLQSQDPDSLKAWLQISPAELSAQIASLVATLGQTYIGSQDD
ncbi:hypothetical protein Pla86_01590 [Planctomycetes bacterium Pla86]|uniref:Uncharacterized protein n=2 Tax=Engelhardtia mirabilis TaxID=2528011 RepID=A0A518BDQ8_9BACT|nr:hypothetical protein Pla133_01590 [Planctomycetes bacterium Pla133]QDU99422.1 hypothetical protein Pla86_01590 [Planctomycetes bacterium Pla86]